MRANRGSDFRNFSPRTPFPAILPASHCPVRRVLFSLSLSLSMYVCVCNQAMAQEPHSFSIGIVLPRIDCDIK